MGYVKGKKLTTIDWFESGSNRCISVGKQIYGDCGQGYEDWYIRNDYKIISAADYLKEGEVEEEDQDKVCEFCRDHYEMSPSYLCEGVKCEDALERYLEDNPTIKKESEMLEINSTIRTVLVNEDKAKFDLVEKVQSKFGNEIEQNFTGVINFRANKQLYIDEIKRIEDEAEKAAKAAVKKCK